MNILVTGGGGFLGTALIKRLVFNGHKVTSFSRKKYLKLEEIGVKSIMGNITDLNLLNSSLKNIDVCFHVAALVKMWGKWEDFSQTNIIGTQNIIKACKNNNVKAMIFTSTPSVVFNEKNIINGSENMPYTDSKLSHYARSKAIAEKYVLDSNSSNFKTLALRPHLMYGPNDTSLTLKLIKAAKSKRLKTIGTGNNLVDVLYVENAVDAHLLALNEVNNKNSKCFGEAFFLGQGPVKLEEFTNKILKNNNAPLVTKKIPFKVAYLLGFILELVYSILKIWDKEPIMTRFIAIQLSCSHYFSHKKALRLLNWKPKITIKESLKLIN